MRKLILLIALMFSINVHADWRDTWAEAVEFCNSKKYDNAEILFSKCIEEIERINEENSPHVYVDRARLYLLLGRYQDALTDLNKAISNPNLSKKELTRALASRISAKSNLGITEGILGDLTVFSESLPAPQNIDFTEKRIIIRNALDCECYKNILSNFFVKSGYCKSNSDIKMLKSGIWIIDRTGKCNCGCLDSLEAASISRKVDICKEACDQFAIAGTVWCSKVFQRADCLIGCLAAVGLIQKWVCYPCCESGEFYKTCIQPYENIVSYMATPCDPYWD